MVAVWLQRAEGRERAAWGPLSVVERGRLLRVRLGLGLGVRG